MAILEIKKYPEEVLKRKSSAVDKIDRDLQQLIDDMLETMYAAPGIGLAAPQVGVLKRLITIDISATEPDCPLLVLLNPEIIETDGLIDSEEGCLSLPDYTTVIKRAGRVVVRGMDREGRPVEIEASDLLARALQHEIDHLDGLLLVDRISPLKREFFKKRFKKLKAAALEN